MAFLHTGSLFTRSQTAAIADRAVWRHQIADRRDFPRRPARRGSPRSVWPDLYAVCGVSRHTHTPHCTSAPPLCIHSVHIKACAESACNSWQVWRPWRGLPATVTHVSTTSYDVVQYHTSSLHLHGHVRTYFLTLLLTFLLTYCLNYFLNYLLSYLLS